MSFYQVNNTTDDSLNSSSGIFISIISSATPYNTLIEIFALILSFGGIALNCCIFIVLKTVTRETSSLKWMKRLALWDCMALVNVGVFGIAFKVYPNLKTFNSLFCKAFSYEWWASSLVANTHVVALAVDRTTGILFPIWHQGASWDNVIWKVSWAIAMFHHLLTLPNWYFYKIQGNLCLMVSRDALILRIYQISIGFVSREHSFHFPTCEEK